MYVVSASPDPIYKTEGAKVVLPHTGVLTLKFHPDLKLLRALPKPEKETKQSDNRTLPLAAFFCFF